MEVLSSEGYNEYHESPEMQTLREKCYGFIAKDGVLNSAFYGQIYNNSAFMLSLNKVWLKNYLINFDLEKIGKTLLAQKLKESSKVTNYIYYLWDSTLKDPLLSFNRHFKINAGFDIYLKQNDYIEILSIGGQDAHKVHNYGINNLVMLLKVMKEIGPMTQKLSEKQKVLFPIKLNTCTPNKYLLVNGQKINITHREFECLQYLGLGYSIKSLANKLEISPRTVETHIQNLKWKTGMFSKEQLVKEFCVSNFILTNPTEIIPSS